MRYLEALVKRSLLAMAALFLFSSLAFGEEVFVDLRYESPLAEQQNQSLVSTVKTLRPVRIQSFTDTRTSGETYLGELKLNGQPRKIMSKTAIPVYATDVFRKVFDERGGKTSVDAVLRLKGEITQFSLDESEGYQARIGFHFFLIDDSGKVLWDGNCAGVVKGSGRTLTPESLSGLFNGILREAYTEMLVDEKLVGVWSGNVQNTYVIRDSQTTVSASSK